MSLKKSIVFTVSVFSIVMAVALASAAKDERSYQLRQILGAKILDDQSVVLSAAKVYPKSKSLRSNVFYTIDTCFQKEAQ